MPHWSARRDTLMALVTGSMLLFAGCSNPVGSSGDATGTPGEPSAVGTAAATATRAAALPIVTPTPIPPGATVPAPDQPGADAGTENPDTYIVQDGDTLYGIALRFGVEIRTIIELNKLADPNDIFAGQELKIPPRE
jgi:LysM repeat protein